MADSLPTRTFRKPRSLDGAPNTMALASQSSRSGSRRAYMTSRRRPRRGRRLFVVILLLALCGGGWWWLRSDDDGGSAEPPVTREPTVPAVVDMTPAKTPAKKSLDPVTGDRDVALGSRGSNRIGETSPSNADDPADSDDPVTASLPAPEKSDPKPEPELLPWEKLAQLSQIDPARPYPRPYRPSHPLPIVWLVEHTRAPAAV